MAMTDFATVDDLIRFLASTAETASDEGLPFSELDHGLQCAYELQIAAPDDEELQVAGLVHDVAHTLGSIESHGEVGARLVEPSLGPRVAALVEGHVPAKRYLVAVDPEYSALLSADSVRTLAIQGGALSPEEITAWEARPHWRESVELRRADDRAKTPGRVVPALEYWIPRLQAVAAGR
jgi:predicted HD phosphohydrolase